MDISNQRRRGRGNTLCGHDFRFGRGGKRWVFVDFLSVITPFLKMNFYMRENGGGGGISCFIWVYFETWKIKIKKCAYRLGYAPSLQRRNRGEKSSCIKQLNGRHSDTIKKSCQWFLWKFLNCCITYNILNYSGLNLNQDKATKPQTVQIVHQGEATLYWFKFNPL